jgi:hypothetical protein
MQYFIVEHPTRGVYTETDLNSKPHFTWSKPRGDDSTAKYYTLEGAQKVCDELNSTLRGCYVVEMYRPGAKWPIAHYRDRKNVWLTREGV